MLIFSLSCFAIIVVLSLAFMSFKYRNQSFSKKVTITRSKLDFSVRK